MSIISIYKSDAIPADVRRRLFARSGADLSTVASIVSPLIKAVHMRGDAPILEKYAQRGVPIDQLRVTKKEIATAAKQVSPEFLLALEQVIANLQAVSNDQLISLQQQPKTRLLGGSIEVWRKWQPETAVGIYAPGGRANYPSTVLMCAVPALTAGCSRLILTVPPQADGTLPAELLVAANRLGITDIFKVGGAQAIAALTYGTQSIPKVSLVVGPGNQYVTAAKVSLFPQIRIDAPAGPSENLIIADSTANSAWVAADLITDCEHGPDSTGLVITTSATLAAKVRSEVELQTSKLATGQVIKESLQRYGAILITRNTKESIALANEYAPEHLQIMTANPLQVAKKITCAGSVFVGSYSAKAAGDYATGANHVLPTGGQARNFGPLAVDTFGTYIEFQSVSKNGLEQLRSTIETFATVEELPAHKESVRVRFAS